MALSNKKILGIITARGGSKGLIRKNILPFGNKPLLAWTIEAAKNSKYIDRVILSTDCSEIKEVALQYSCEVPFIRPADLATDTATSADVISHVLKNIDGFDYFVLLQPTSPLRSSNDIDSCIEKCINENAPSCISVCKSDIYPQLMYSIEDKQVLKPLLSGEYQTRRQDMKNYYTLNGSVYVVNISFFKKHGILITNHSICFEMPKERSIDIDDEFDFSIAEFILNKNLMKEI
ncbi:acylneuraminate cytidylyltransferase family protein [Pigmentibacter ruber]|uniref:acylneuraminate cytidylyltransferase family protein n=1 Tax=Pigmentibacter ruber TaxID=2683196 RepID=UPI00131D64B5|nr:acylneuraminate cytidylyltransferase family protein [Pigmentibacter ruber]